MTTTYQFENPTDEAVTLTMDFPKRHYGPDDDYGFDNQFTNLHTTIHGERVTQRIAEADPEAAWIPNLSHMYLFNVQFTPSKTIKIMHHYRMDQSNSIDGRHEVLYVTRTGAL